MSTIDQEMVVAHFIVSDNVERSRRFYTEVLGGKTVISSEAGDEVTYVALANSWIIINVGGGPTDDKPTVTLQTPQRYHAGRADVAQLVERISRKDEVAGSIPAVGSA